MREGQTKDPCVAVLSVAASSSSMDLPHGVLELDDDIARGANGSVRCALPYGVAVCVEIRHRNIPVAAHAPLLNVTLAAWAGVITGVIGEREIVAARLCDGTSVVAAGVLCARGGR
jgi:hypothetical protein